MLNPWCLTKSHSLIPSFEHGKINIMLMIYEIFIVLLNIVYFPFFSVQTSKTVFHWIIVQDDKNSISSCEPNFFCKTIKRVCVLVNLLLMKCIELISHICLHVFPVLWHLDKKYTTTVGTITLSESLFFNNNHFISWQAQLLV